MVSRGRLDDSIKRRAPRRAPKHRILIVCEGRVTEPVYFRAFKDQERNPLVHVEIAPPAGRAYAVVSTAVARRTEAESDAKRERDQTLRWDEVWAVFDVDDHPKLDEAQKLATDNAIELAISNPCFELWALLHFQDQRAHIERHKARAALQEHLPGYDKSPEFTKMHAGYADATRRARALDDEAAQHADPGRNPTTDVYRLTESIRAGGLR